MQVICNSENWYVLLGEHERKLKQIDYYFNGKIADYYEYDNNEKVQIWKSYFRDGTLKSEQRYVSGNPVARTPVANK